MARVRFVSPGSRPRLRPQRSAPWLLFATTTAALLAAVSLTPTGHADDEQPIVRPLDGQADGSGTERVILDLREGLPLRELVRMHALTVSRVTLWDEDVDRLLASTLHASHPAEIEVSAFPAFLTHTLREAGLLLVEDEALGVIRVRRRATAQPGVDPPGAPHRIERLPLSHSVTEELMDAIGTLQIDGLHVGEHRRTNQLLLRGSDEHIKLVRELIEKLDVPTGFGGSYVHVFRLKHRPARELARLLDGPITEGIAHFESRDDWSPLPIDPTPLIVRADPTGNQLIVLGTVRAVQELTRILDQVDQPAPGDAEATAAENEGR